MTDIEELASMAVATARQAIDTLDALTERVDEHDLGLARASLFDLDDDTDTMIVIERYAAKYLLMAVADRRGETVLDAEEPDEADRAWSALKRGGLDEAEVAASEILQRLQHTEPDDWNYGNLIHDAHIVRGTVLLRRGDLHGAEAELRAAAKSPGSPQLDSFGPDLSLAWDLLTRGRDRAALDYLDGVSGFWAPHAREA